MTEAGSFSQVSARSALHLASLFDLSTRAAEYDPAKPILNAALLSVMGRLKVLRLCVLRPSNGRFACVLSKGLPVELLMANVQTAFNVLARLLLPLTQILTSIHVELREFSDNANLTYDTSLAVVKVQ